MAERDKYTIYTITFPNDKVYVGYTSLELNKRIKKHKESAKHEKKKRTPIMNALRKFEGQEVWFVLEIVDTIEKAHEREIAYIEQRDSTNPKNGYNISLGGDGVKHTTYTKAKISKGAVLTNKKRFADPENVRRQKKALTKHWAKKGEKLKASVKCGAKSFLVKDRDTEKIIGRWVSQRACARDLGISPSIVNNCLKGRRSHCGRYVFNFIGEAHE